MFIKVQPPHFRRVLDEYQAMADRVLGRVSERDRAYDNLITSADPAETAEGQLNVDALFRTESVDTAEEEGWSGAEETDESCGGSTSEAGDRERNGLLRRLTALGVDLYTALRLVAPHRTRKDWTPGPEHGQVLRLSQPDEDDLEVDVTE